MENFQASDKFVNRVAELSQLARTNIGNYSHNSIGMLQNYFFPVSIHTYGAGKTQLVEHYVKRLREKEVQDAIESEIGVVQLLKHFKSKDKAELDQVLQSMTSIVVLTQEDVAGTLEQLVNTVRGSPVSPPATVTVRWAAGVLREALERVLSEQPVFLAVDEIGRLKTYDNFRELRKQLIDIIKTLRTNHPNLYPLHIAAVGRVDAAMAVGSGDSPTPNQRIVLAPLEACHVSEIYQYYYDRQAGGYAYAFAVNKV